MATGAEMCPRTPEAPARSPGSVANRIPGHEGRHLRLGEDRAQVGHGATGVDELVDEAFLDDGPIRSDGADQHAHPLALLAKTTRPRRPQAAQCHSLVRGGGWGWGNHRIVMGAAELVLRQELGLVHSGKPAASTRGVAEAKGVLPEVLCG